MGLRVLLFSLYEIFSFPLKISLMVLYPFKPIPTPKVAQSLGWLTKGLRDDGQEKSMACRWHPPWPWCCPGMSPWEPHGADKTLGSASGVIGGLLCQGWETALHRAKSKGRSGSSWEMGRSEWPCTDGAWEPSLTWTGFTWKVKIKPFFVLEHLPEENTPLAARGLFFVAPGFGNVNYFSS